MVGSEARRGPTVTRPSSRPGTWLVLGVFASIAIAACGGGQTTPEERPAGETAAATSEGDYPAPRYPRYVVDTEGAAGRENLLKMARVAVRQSSGRSPLGVMQNGETVHVLVLYDQDMRVFEVIQEAWKERGVDARPIWAWDLFEMSKEEYEQAVKSTLQFGNEGWRELGTFEISYKQFFPEDIQKEFNGSTVDDRVIRREHRLRHYLDKHPEVQHIFAGEGGGNFWQASIGENHAKKFRGNWIYLRPMDLLSKAAEFPPDLWNLVEDKILAPVPSVSEVTFQDPEGTNLHWKLTPAESQLWNSARSGAASNHISIYPSPLQSTLEPGGVVAAASNHTGFYPTMRVHLGQYGLIERIEGGGKNGELFRMLVEHPKFKSAKFPLSPVQGYWFLRQDGFATNPKFVRSMTALTKGASSNANMVERNRAGVQHMAFSYPADDPVDLQYAKDHGIEKGLFGHTAHMHVYFPTVRWRLRDTGEWKSIAEKGQVSALGDEEVRALAARYGDPDLMLRYEWVPAIPGINVPGDYERDYAADPWAALMQEWKRIQDGTYENFVEAYTLQGMTEQ
jgi:hypothetical protein